jgi:hypothetical protein
MRLGSQSKKASRLFFGNKKDDLQIGDLFAGEVKEYKTTSYFIKEDNWYDTITVIVFSDEEGLEIAAKELRYHKAYALDENGNIYKSKTQPSGKVNDDFDYELQERMESYSNEQKR